MEIVMTVFVVIAIAYLLAVFFILCICAAAKRADRRTDEMHVEKDAAIDAELVLMTAQ